MPYYKRCLQKLLNINHGSYRWNQKQIHTISKYKSFKFLYNRIKPFCYYKYNRFCLTSSTPTSKADDIGHAEIDYETIYKDRTGVTSGLWRLRYNLSKTDNPFDINNPPKRAALVERPPWHSSIVITYDFVDKPNIKNEYIRFDGGVRLGRILEDMDSLAGNVAEVHNDNNDGYPIAFVTASVDRIDLKRRFPMNRNLAMEGVPIFVGKTSINVQISIYDKADPDFVICTANFIMVAKDQVTKKSTTINPLLLSDEKEHQNFIRGRFDAQLKKEERLKKLTSVKPSSEESNIIHQFWLDIYHRNRINMNDKDKYISINETSLSNIVICQPQNLNRNGKIFGGYLMKIAYELARVTAYTFIGGIKDLYASEVDLKTVIENHPQFVSSDEISFEHPVSVGCIIRNVSYIACTDTMNVMDLRSSKEVIEDDGFYYNRKAMMLFVRTYIQEPGQSKQILSNVFSFCYAVPSPTSTIRRVVPLTYEESMIYLAGKRALDQTTRIAIRDGSTFAKYL